MREIVEKRGRNSKTFDLGNGKYRLETGNHPHTLKNGLWLPVDMAVEAEAGRDADVNMNYIARSRFETLDYDIRFGKNDPVWMKIKHLPTNKTVVFKPRNNNNKPDHTISGNKISVSQAWDGIDMEIFVTDQGTKTNYIITSPSGQRVVEFNVSGDLGSFRVSPPWYKLDSPLPVIVPTSFASGVMSYDLRQVPVGTVVDPSVSVEETNDVGNKSYYMYQPDGNNFVSGVYIGQIGTVHYRTLAIWDLSSVSGPIVASNSVIKFKEVGAAGGTGLAEICALKVPFGQNQGVDTASWVYRIGGASAVQWQTGGADGANDIVTPGGTRSLDGSISNAYLEWTGSGIDAVVEQMVNVANYGILLRSPEKEAMIGNHYNEFSSSLASAGSRPVIAFDYEVSSGVSAPSFGPGKQYPFHGSWRSWR